MEFGDFVYDAVFASEVTGDEFLKDRGSWRRCNGRGRRRRCWKCYFYGSIQHDALSSALCNAQEILDCVLESFCNSPRIYWEIAIRGLCKTKLPIFFLCWLCLVFCFFDVCNWNAEKFDVFQCIEVSYNEYNFNIPTTFLYRHVTAICT